ncbi:STAS domain-containing protein [Streptacidiphilus sp. N1-12]|uniref:Anti-sigma factor antagonist n=2 Tax=Streptacidiphilus alkalitolerans TaxID=3342712 RepID=A0ABV6V480_9ACTN
MTDPTLDVSRQNRPNGDVVLTLVGELDFSTSAHFTRALEEAPVAPATEWVIDLSDLRYCDSTGITAFVTAYQRVQAAGSSLVLAGVSSELMRVFRIVGLDQVFTFRPPVPDGIGDPRS